MKEILIINEISKQKKTIQTHKENDAKHQIHPFLFPRTPCNLTSKFIQEKCSVSHGRMLNLYVTSNFGSFDFNENYFVNQMIESYKNA